MTKINNIVVNTKGANHEYRDFPPHREIEAAMAECAKQHPSWTSMVVVVVKTET